MRSYPKDDSEFSSFFTAHYAPLVLYILRFTEDQETAEDIAEEAFINLWNKRDTFSDIRFIKSYLYTIARNGYHSWVRKTRRDNLHNETAAILQEDKENTALENLIYAETMRKIYAAIDKLPAQCRRVLIKHYIEGKKVSEIAREMNIAVGTVKTHKIRGIHLLQKGWFAIAIILRFVM